MAPQQNEELKTELVLKAAAVRDIMGFASERGIALREVLKGGVLSGQSVYFQSRHGPILNKGEGHTLVPRGVSCCTSLSAVKHNLLAGMGFCLMQ